MELLHILNNLDPFNFDIPEDSLAWDAVIGWRIATYYVPILVTWLLISKIRNLQVEFQWKNYYPNQSVGHKYVRNKHQKIIVIRIIICRNHFIFKKFLDLWILKTKLY